MELESVKKQSANTLARLTQIENRLESEGRQNKPDSRKHYPNEDDYYYGPEY